jgi:uncharacterized membrane protein
MFGASRLEELEARIATLERHLAHAQLAPAMEPLDACAAGAAGNVAHDPGAAPRRPSRAPIASGASRVSGLRGRSAGDVVGGRVLAWLGGAALLAGIVLFLALAVSHGWIGEQARVLAAAALCSSLMATGAWLHACRGRTEAARALVGAATAGMFATIVVASAVYGLVPASLAALVAMALGALATALAIRWAGQVIAGLGLIGGLLSGVLVGAPVDPASGAVLAIAATCAMCVVVRRKWGWLAVATVVVCAPQWAVWMLQGEPLVLDVLVLCVFAALGMVGAVGLQAREPAAEAVPASVAVLALSTCMTAAIGRVALGDAGGAVAGEMWLAALAAAHIGCSAWCGRRERVAPAMRRLLLATGVALADVAFALSAHGVVLALGWSATAVGIAWLGRRAPEGDRAQQRMVDIAVGAHIALALMRALIDAPPSQLAGGEVQALSLLSVASVAAACVACGQIDAEGGSGHRRIALHATGLAAIAYLTACGLDGAALTAAWAFEGLALAQLGARAEDRVARVGAGTFVAGAALNAVLAVAPPADLGSGSADVGAAAVALGALAAVAWRGGCLHVAASARRQWAWIAAGGCLLYLASIALVTVFEPTAGGAGGAVLELSVGQQGQVLLSALWGVVGLGALVLGLRAQLAAVRTAGVALLLVAVGKVFLYDLATLTSLYRVVSFMVLGALLLAGAYAYQRLRPPPLPDLRSVHPSQR